MSGEVDAARALKALTYEEMMDLAKELAEDIAEHIATARPGGGSYASADEAEAAVARELAEGLIEWADAVLGRGADPDDD